LKEWIKTTTCNILHGYNTVKRYLKAIHEFLMENDTTQVTE